MKVAAWLAVTALALALAAAVGLQRAPLATPPTPTPPHFSFGPVAGPVTQSLDVPRGPVETVTIWARSEGARPVVAQAHLLRSADGPPLRSAVFEAPLGADLRITRIPFVPIDLSPGTLMLRVLAPEGSPAALYVGATRHDAYQDGHLVDHLGHSPVDIDLAFSATGHAGPLTRVRTQASEAPLHLAVGLVVAVMAGVAAGGIAWSTLARERFGRLTALAVGCGIVAAVIAGPLLGPVTFP